PGPSRGFPFAPFLRVPVVSLRGGAVGKKGNRRRAKAPRKGRKAASPPAGAPATLQDELRREPNPVKRFLKILGPGLVTGASDDDPSGIGTYATAGASLGYATLWTAPLTYPL